MALTNKPIFQDKRTKEKIDRHLSDPNDQITESDIANVVTDVTKASWNDEVAVQQVNGILLEKSRRDKNKEDENNSNSVETPWNMLD